LRGRAAEAQALYRFATPTERIKGVTIRASRHIVWLSLLVFAFAGVPLSRVSGADEKLCPVHHVPLRKEKSRSSTDLSLIPAIRLITPRRPKNIFRMQTRSFMEAA
jgi:hypothetical protein